MNKVVEYIIGAKDATAGAIKSALRRLKSFALSVGSNLQNIRAGIGMFQTAMSNAMAFMQKAFAFEKMTVEFKMLIGNMDDARAHMKMLQKLGDTPPFSLEEFAAASRQLMIMSEGALGYKKSLELVGDAAAATGQPIQNLAHEIGRAYAIIRDGQPLARATMGLRNMGAITPEVAAKLDDLQKSGASVRQIWDELATELGKFKGAMEETEETGSGLMGAIEAQWDDSLRTFGAALLETSKDGLQRLLDKMRTLSEDGTIDVWARHVVEMLHQVKEAAETVGTALGAIWDYSGLSDAWHYSMGALKGATYTAVRAGHGWLVNDESFSGAMGEALHGGNVIWSKEAARGHYVGQLADAGYLGSGMKWAADDNRRDDERARRQDERIRTSARERLRKRKEADEKRAAELEKQEQERIQAQLAEAQAKLDAKRAEEKAKADADAAADAAKKAAEEEEKIRLTLEREIAKERERLWRSDLKAQEQAYRLARQEEADARARLQDAAANEQKAWGWYRNRASWKAQLEEERADAEAQKQFDKDFASLKGRVRDWRTSDRLSDDDELIRRVALAREEKAAAEEYARATAEAAQACADALEAIQETMTQEEF